MKTIADLYYKIAPDAPGASESVLFNALYDAVREFLRKTLAWQQELDAMDITSGVTDYIIEPNIEDEEDPLIASVVAVDYDEDTMDPWEYSMADHETLRLSEAPTSDVTGGLVITVALVPNNGNGYVPDDILNRWDEAIAAVARWNLLRQPKKPWTDVQAAASWRREFMGGINMARAEVLRGNGTTNQLRVKMRSL